MLYSAFTREMKYLSCFQHLKKPMELREYLVRCFLIFKLIVFPLLADNLETVVPANINSFYSGALIVEATLS